MKTSLSLGVALALAVGQEIDCADKAEACSPSIQLRVINASRVDRRTLTLAKKELTEILARAGVSVIWLSCTSGGGDLLSADPCQGERRPFEFWLWIVMRNRGSSRANVLAFTELDESLGLRSSTVCYLAVVEEAGKHGLPTGAVLGAVIAHEVGHLVLGANAHARQGLMSPNWSRLQFELLSISELSFTRREAQLIKDELGNGMLSSCRQKLHPAGCAESPAPRPCK